MLDMADQENVALKSLLGETLLSSGAKSQPVSDLEGKNVILYFSAHWCGPCRRFTPTLAKCHEALKRAGRPVEVVFVSLDRSDADFQEYFGSMPWKAVPQKGSAGIAQSFGVTTIPRLVVLDPNGAVINGDAVQRVVQDPEGRDFPWEGEPPFWTGGSNTLLKNILLAVLVIYVLYKFFLGKSQAEKGL